MDTEDRTLWYQAAETWEREFIDIYGSKLGLIINPSKAISKYAPDLYILKSSISADLKRLRTPLYKSQEIFGIPPQFCWTFNPSDLFDYSVNYSDNFGIFVWQSFEGSCKFGVSVDPIEAVYYVNLFNLKRLINRSGGIHKYIKRMNDTSGNSYGSHGVDIRSLRRVI